MEFSIFGRSPSALSLLNLPEAKCTTVDMHLFETVKRGTSRGRICLLHKFPSTAFDPLTSGNPTKSPLRPSEANYDDVYPLALCERVVCSVADAARAQAGYEDSEPYQMRHRTSFIRDILDELSGDELQFLQQF